MKDDCIYDLMGKYLVGEISEEEKSIFEDWLCKSEENREEFINHKRVWEESAISFRSPDAEATFKKILNAIDDEQAIDIAAYQNTVRSRSKHKIVIFGRIAASLLIIAAILFVLRSKMPTEIQEQVSINTIQKQNPAGQKSHIFLPDGSEVWLNSESSISYLERFTGAKREVILKGEAFFNVVKNHDQPFIVKAGEVTTTVLGTSFNVKAFESESTTYVALQSGSIKVDIKNEHGNQELLLEPGYGINYNRSSHVAVKEEFDEQRLLGWKDGVIVFKDADLEEVVSTLSRWYGVQFEIKNKKGERWTYTGGPFENEILENVLNVIGYSEKFSHEFVNQEYVIIELN